MRSTLRTDAAKISAPTEDKRWRIISAAMRRYGYAPDALIETLHSVQETFGFIDDDALKWVAKSLRLPPSHVYGVATFYDHFKLKPQGKHTCVICMGTACYIKGNNHTLHELERRIGIKAGGTTRDKNVSLLVARCLGACGLAPAVVLDGEVLGKAIPEGIARQLQAWMQAESSHPTSQVTPQPKSQNGGGDGTHGA